MIVEEQATLEVSSTPDTSAENSAAPEHGTEDIQGTSENDGSQTDPLETADKTTSPSKKSSPQPSPEALFEKRFRDMEAKFTRTRQQELAEKRANEALQKQIADMSQAIQQLTKKPYSPADFIRDLQQKGPEAVIPLIQEEKAKIAEELRKEIAEVRGVLDEERTLRSLAERRSDSENYPDFRELEPVMKEILDEQGPKFNLNRAPGELMDELYKLAKERKADEALKDAEQFGRKNAERQLAKEAKANVAGGGKTAGSAMPDISKMSTGKLREHLASLGAVADRD